MNIKETIIMLEEIRKQAGMPHYYRPNVTEIKNVSPESFDFVIGAAIAGLHIAEKKDDSWVKEYRGMEG